MAPAQFNPEQARIPFLSVNQENLFPINEHPFSSFSSHSMKSDS
jgi:hypothetical protein